jgi:hypothetical protein
VEVHSCEKISTYPSSIKFGNRNRTLEGLSKMETASDIFHSREGQEIISRMAGMQVVKDSVRKVMIPKDQSKKK